MPQRRGNIMNAASWRAFWASCSCNQVGYPHCCQLPHACPTSWPLQTAVTQTLNDFVSGTCTWMEKAVKLMQSRAEGQVSRWAAADKVSKIEPRAGEPAIRASSIEQQIVMANVQKKKYICIWQWMFGNSGGSGGRVCSLQFAGDKIVSTNKWRTAESQTAREKRFKFIAPTCAICIHSSPLVAPFLRFMG